MVRRTDPYERLAVNVGRIDEVSPSILTVLLDSDAPHGTSLSHGGLQRFPYVNGFIVVPTEAGPLLAVVVWIGIADRPRDPHHRDPDLLALPQGRRILRAVPLGVVKQSHSSDQFALERGALAFPTVGDPVRLATPPELATAAPRPRNGVALRLGTAPMVSGADVLVSPNRLLGRHLAILGNTGSGKSCSLTQIIGEASFSAAGKGTLRAVILDLNGEYGRALSHLDPLVPVRRFSVEAESEVDPLRVPYWLWNYREWASFANASDRTQAPILRQALHILRTSAFGGLPKGVVTLMSGRRTVREFNREQITGNAVSIGLSALDRVRTSCATLAQYAPEASSEINALAIALKAVLDPKRGSGSYLWSYGVAGPDAGECERLAVAFDNALTTMGMPKLTGDTSSVDTPTPFDAMDLPELVDALSAGAGADVANWVAPMRERLIVAMSDDRLARTSGYQEGESLGSWLADILGDTDDGQISVIDLSLIPRSAQQVMVAVITRLLLEALERHKRLGTQVPVILAVEEAHSLVPRHTAGPRDDVSVQASELCREAFERVSREGRKFGLSLIISSQRPSEISETVLSQCNSFLIHRIVNARDQDLIRRLVPDDLGTLLAEISSYPSRTALLMGAAVEIPVLTEIAELPLDQRPDAPDPDFSRAWSSKRAVDFGQLAHNWAPSPESHASDSVQPDIVVPPPLDEDTPPF